MEGTAFVSDSAGLKLVSSAADHTLMFQQIKVRALLCCCPNRLTFACRVQEDNSIVELHQGTVPRGAAVLDLDVHPAHKFVVRQQITGNALFPQLRLRFA